MAFLSKSAAPTGSSGKGGKAPLSVAAKLREQVALDATIQNDPKYKKYAQQVEKCLASFESMHEWPDFIAFLKQLLKTVQSYPQFKEIPRKLIVSKRLSQCLIPALPSGVHQRALDVYSELLSILGPEGLKRDLPLWSSGLFPFFEYASTSVKPTLLGIFEKYYLPLQDDLRPVMRAFILALLPGLEEETGEFFDRVMALLDKLAGTVSQSFFLQNIWLIMLATQVPRAYCLNYLSRRLPRLDANEDITHIIGRDTGLMIRAFSAALSDDNLLVQRGALDLLLQSLRVESHAVTQASPEDRTILMRAATGVVLRRDLSLNRRLFSWLLGPDEHSEKQIEYFQKNALALLSSTLRDEMFNPSSEYSMARPFRIYISLLDKWEIGAPLTEEIVYDALRAVKKVVDDNAESGEDLLVTATSMFEAVEPRAAWKHLYKAVRKEIVTSETGRECIDMFAFVLNTFRVDEEEVKNIHLPLILCAIVEKLEEIAREQPSKIDNLTFCAAMSLLDRIVSDTPITSMTNPLQLADIAFGGSFDDAACAFYKISVDYDTSDSPQISKQRRWSSAIPFIASFERLAELTSICVATHLPESQPAHHISDLYAFTEGVALVLKMVTNLTEASASPGPLTISWDAEAWLGNVLRPLGSKRCSFTAVDSAITLAIRLHSTSVIEPTPSLNNRQRLLSMMDSLMTFLKPNQSSYHVRAVQLVWDLEHATSHRHIESILSQTLVAGAANMHLSDYDAFGVFWRLSEDSQQPGMHFKIPMLSVLDTLKSNDPALRRVGETWMRCNLGSYPRLLDPILLELLTPTIVRRPVIRSIVTREINVLEYQRPFDQHRVIYLLDILLTVVHFGGHNFSRVTAAKHISNSYSPQFIEDMTREGFLAVDATYMAVIIEILLRYLHSEPRSRLMSSMQQQNLKIHALVVEVLQAIVSRGDLDHDTIESIEAAIIAKLFMLVHSERLELQNKLLHLLHSVVSSSASLAKRQAAGAQTSILNSTESAMDNSDEAIQPEHPTAQITNPLLVQLLVDGISIPSNRPLLHHWLDFVLMTIPRFPHILASTITPLNACVCRQIRSSLNDVSLVSAHRSRGQPNLDSYADDVGFIMLLNALEHLVLIALNEANLGASEEHSPLDKSGSDGAGLLSMVSNVFLTESQNQSNEPLMTPRSPAYRSLHEGIGILYSTWSVVSESPEKSHPAYDSLSLVFSRTMKRCKETLEKLYRVHAFEVIESVIEFWNTDKLVSKSGEMAFDIIDFLTASSQNVVHIVCESISWRISPSGERNRKQVLNPELTDTSLFTFLEEYLSKLQNPLAIQVWPRFLTLAKDVAANAKEFRYQSFPALRCTNVLALKLSQTSTNEDRRIRKDIQETYGKLLDACVLISGRALDQGLWSRRNLAVNGRDSPLPRSRSDTNLIEKSGAASISSDQVQKVTADSLTDKINDYLVEDVLPNIRRFLVENDKVLSACSNIIYYIVGPVLKLNAGRVSEVNDVYIKILEQMTKITAAFKSWKSPVTDVFADQKFFSMTPDLGLRWQPIVKTLIDAEKAAFAELLGRITSAPSANIFTNREYEMQLRAQNLRRLSFVLFASEKNHFLTQLPAVQEKMVDILRNGSAPIVESEVFLCVRVLLCRLSPHNLSSFWPVLLAELIRVFEQTMAEPPSDGSENLQAILAACKLVDLLLVLQTVEFQIHQWIFITDTVDAIYRPDEWSPEALVDQLSETIGELPPIESRRRALTLPDATTSRGMRQPLLRGVKHIDSIQDLAPFFSHLSIVSYEGVYASGGSVDWDAVERSLVEDMFDGRQ